MNRQIFFFIGAPLVCLGLLTLLTSCDIKKGREEVKKISLTPSQLAARFPYDLGPATVEISAYPENIQQSYKLFLAACSICHTSARPLNAPYIKAADWKRFVHRMHLKMDQREISLDKETEKKIIEFLVYDSKVRKMDKKQEFDQNQEKLNLLFSELVKEREKFIQEETEKLPKKETPYVGVQ